ncbi:MAG TPA: TlpA family protein disulfide reductase, partial [Actinomycetota bacterium]
MPRRTTLAVVVVAVAAAVVAVVALAGGGGKGLAPEAATGQVDLVSSGVAVVPEANRPPLPAFTGRTLDGRELDLASLRGRPLVLNFWASW